MNNVIQADTINRLYKEACFNLICHQDMLYPTNHKLYTELIGSTLVLTNPYDHVISIPERKLSLRYLFGEFAFYMKGSNKLKDINKYSKFWNTISDDGETVSSGYGYKLFNLKGDSGMNQYDHAMHHLRKNKFSKRATMLINTPENSIMKTKDTPCTMYLQFFIRKSRLTLITNMRSNDIFFGVPYDISFFTMLQELALVQLQREAYPELKMGSYIHKTGSLHMYAKDKDIIDNIAFSDYTEPFHCPKMEESTIDKLNRFLAIEEGLVEGSIQDAFLNTALHYIKGGK